MTRYQSGQFTAEDAQALAGQRADIHASGTSLATRYIPGKTYENAIIVRAEGDQLILADPGEYGGYEQAEVPLASVRQIDVHTDDEGNPWPLIPPVAVLHGHDSPETAYLIEDYPYGRYERCKMRVWIERAGKGAKAGQYRVMRQTTDPKRSGPGRPGKYGQGEVGPDGSPWNAPKGSTYYAWMVMYRNPVNGHIREHVISYGLGGAGDARMRLDGTYAQLTAEEREGAEGRIGYDTLARASRKADGSGWDDWRKALEFIDGFRLERGGLPGPREVRDAPGFHLRDYSYDVAVAAVTAGLVVG